MPLDNFYHHQHPYHHQHHHGPNNGQRNHAKRESKPLHLLSFCVSIPHPDKLFKHGEDATFQSTRAIGIFDGVGAWADAGIDAGKYSKRLAHLVKQRMQNNNSGAYDAMRYAVRSNTLQGSCTACVAEIKGRKLTGVNVGDSGLMIIRDKEQVYSTKDQNHGFNHPYQVSYKDHSDLDYAEFINFNLSEGDILIFASDGLWDNSFKHEIVRTTKRHCEKWDASGFGYRPSDRELRATRAFSGSIVTSEVREMTFKGNHEGIGDRLQNLSLDIARKACKTAHKSVGTSPFAQKAELANVPHLGGKLDDISIVIGLAVSTNRDRYRAQIEAVCPDCYQH